MDVLTKTRQMAAFLDRKLATNITVLDMRNITLMADTFIIVTGKNIRQNQALADYLKEEFGKEGLRPSRVEGYRSGGWILVDYGDVIVHIFTKDQREFYNLEKLWADAPEFSWEEDSPNK